MSPEMVLCRYGGCELPMGSHRHSVHGTYQGDQILIVVGQLRQPAVATLGNRDV